MSETRILQGDVRATLASLPAGCVQLAITSPPYWALRSYLKPGDPLKPLEMGSERTPEEFVANLVGVFRAVRRVLRDDGVCVVNLGDSYAQSGMGGNPEESEYRKQATNGGSLIAGRQPAPGLKPLDRVGIPERFALAMQADGWYWRDTVVWAKTSAMPSSVNGWRWERCRVKVGTTKHEAELAAHAEDDGIGRTTAGLNVRKERGAVNGWEDCPGCPKCAATGGYVLRKGALRTTTAHEYLFVFTKTDCYFGDRDGWATRARTSTLDRLDQDIDGQLGSPRPNKSNGNVKAVGGATANLRSVLHLGPEPCNWDFCLACGAYYVGAERKRIKRVCADCGELYVKRNKKWVRACGCDGDDPPARRCECGATDGWVDHYAMYPTSLIRPFVAAFTSDKGCCPTCGACWARVVAPGQDVLVSGPKHGQARQQNAESGRHFTDKATRLLTTTLGWRPTCTCETWPVVSAPVPCVVLDPFLGGGTTAGLANAMGRAAIGCELNPRYVELARLRIAAMAKPETFRTDAPGAGSLFAGVQP